VTQRRNKMSLDDPSKDYLSKYIVDLNKRDLNKFFKPAVSISALAIILFLTVATFSPLREGFFSQLYPKQKSQAEVKQTSLSFIAPSLDPKLKEDSKISVIITPADLNIKEVKVKIIFPKDKIRIFGLNHEGSFISKWTKSEFDNTDGTISLEGETSPTLVSSSKLLAAIVFTPIKAGETIFIFDDSSQVLNNNGENILTTKESKTLNIN